MLSYFFVPRWKLTVPIVQEIFRIGHLKSGGDMQNLIDPCLRWQSFPFGVIHWHCPCIPHTAQTIPYVEVTPERTGR